MREFPSLRREKNVFRLLGSVRLNYLVDYKNVWSVGGWMARERREKMLGGWWGGGFVWLYGIFFSLSIFFSPLVLVWCAGKCGGVRDEEKNSRKEVLYSRGWKKSPEERKNRRRMKHIERPTSELSFLQSFPLLRRKPPSLYTFFAPTIFMFWSTMNALCTATFFLPSMDITL